MGKLSTWKKLQDQLKLIKEQELELRKEICSEILEGRIGEISEKATFEGTLVRVKMTVTRNVDEDVLSTIWSDLTIDEQQAIKFKPSLVLAGYRKLHDGALLHEAVTVKPSETPTLEILD